MAQEPTDTPPLGGTILSWLPSAIRHHTSGCEPPAHARQHPGIPNSQLHEPHCPRLVQTAEEVAKVGLQHTTDLLSSDDFVQRGQGVMRTPSGPTTTRAVEAILLVDGFQNLRRTFLEGSISDRGNPKRALCCFARFWYPHSPNGRRLIPLGMDLPQNLLRSPVQVLGDLGDGVPLDTRCTGLVHVAAIVSQPIEGDVVGERGARELWFPASCRGYPFPCCCHGIRPSWLWVQHAFPPGVGTVLPFPGACSADPFPLDAALPPSAH